MDSLELHDLRVILSGDGDDTDDRGKGYARREPPADGTIEISVANELLAALKPLGTDAGRSFVKKFNVARIRDLKVRDLKAARAFIASLQPDSSAAIEVDPFA
jgi:hypothetical protein